MSETTANTNAACELVLDYVYGELDEARKRAFEEHLPGCARCQQEVASFGRVRTAAKRLMPAVEPPAQLGGALHTQLMHAAAQRKPRRGMLLAFPRKIVEHPALSAAAMFVLVGGAIAINWSHGKMAMPASEQPADSPKPTEVAAAPPLLAEPVPAAKVKEETIDNKGGDKVAAADETKIALATPTGGPLTVQRTAAHHAATAAASKKSAPAKNLVSDGKAGRLDDALAKDDANGSLGSVTGGAIGGAGGRAESVVENEKSSAPAELARKTERLKAPARDAKLEHGYATGAPATTTPQASSSMQQAWGNNNAPAAPPPVVATAPAASREPSGYYARGQATAAPVQKPAANSRNFEALRKQADENAKTNHCDEAIKLYRELEKSGQKISPTERVNWVHCLTQQGRQEEAQQRFDELRSEKRVTKAQLQDAEKELNDSRRRVEGKKAKKAPAADRAPTQQQQQQQRAAEPTPAQASPPDSTNTKVKPAL